MSMYHWELYKSGDQGDHVLGDVILKKYRKCKK